VALNRRLLAGAAIGLALAAGPVGAAERDDFFREALRRDLAGGSAGASEAFALFRRAAEAGLPEAQFNVAVMLDSGRGVAPDTRLAAIWYARAAANGNKRAAYNLGQLYEAGDGVPRNLSLAKLWFARSELPAAKTRLAALPRETAPPELAAVTAEAPAAGARLDPETGTVELVWTTPPQPPAARFYVEVRDVGAEPPATLAAEFAPASSLAVALPAGGRDFAWRVLAVDPTSGRYRSTPWSRFSRASP
jgi:TPR repeat protein